MMNKSEVIREVELFEFLTDDIVAGLADAAKEMSFSKGELVFHEEERAENVYILVEGKISMGVSLTSKPAKITVSVLDTPYLLCGWSAIVKPYRFTAYGLCEEDTKVLAIPGDTILDMLEQNPGVAYTVMKLLTELISGRLRSTRMVTLRTM